jgi:hypothetical protein
MQIKNAPPLVEHRPINFPDLTVLEQIQGYFVVTSIPDVSALC